MKPFRRAPLRSGLPLRRTTPLPFPVPFLPRLLVNLLLLVCALGFAQEPAQLNSRTFEIAGQLRCPVCVSESVAESSSPTSVQMRREIQEQLEQGRSEAQILAYFQERYGDWILLEPPKRGLHLLVWLLPLVAAIVGLAALVYFVRRWTRASHEPVDVDDEDLRRVREAMADGR